MKTSGDTTCRRLTTVLLLLVAQTGVGAQSIAHSDLWEGVDRDRAAKVAADALREVEKAPTAEAAETAWLANADRLRRDGGVAVESLGRFLDSKDPSQRSAAVWLLDRIGGAVVAPTLLRAVANHPDPNIRLEALRGLVEGNEFVSVARVLREVLEEQTDPDLLRYAKDSLEQAFPEPPQGMGRAPLNLRSDHTADHDLGEATRRVRALVAEAMESSTLRIDGKVFAIGRAHSTAAQQREIIELGRSAVPALIEYAWSGSGFEWRVARELLTALGGGAIVSPLSSVIREHPVVSQRFGALITMVEATGFKRIGKALRRAEQSDDNPEVAEYAQSVLNEAATGK